MTMSNQDDINNSEEQKLDAGFDITGLLLDYASHWKWFLLSVAVVLAGAYYYRSEERRVGKECRL